MGRLHILRSRFPVIINETRVLNLTLGNDTAVYTVTVPANVYALRVTLVYADPLGNPDAGVGPYRHARNNLTLKVTAPNGTTVYWGNCGLREGNWSSSLCTTGDRPFPNDPNTVVIDTVENVFVQPPVAVGTWTMRVIAEEIVADARPETPGVNDVDFALVVSIDPDCNQNGSSDADDILRLVGPSPDCNNNGVPDECESPIGACCFGTTCTVVVAQTCCSSQGGTFIGEGTTCEDCNGNGAPDACEEVVGPCCLPPNGPCVLWTAECCWSVGGAVMGQRWCTPSSCDLMPLGPAPTPGP